MAGASDTSPPLRLFLIITIILFFLISIRVHPWLEEDGAGAPSDSVAISNAISGLQDLPAGATSDRSEQLRQELLRELGAIPTASDSATTGGTDNSAVGPLPDAAAVAAVDTTLVEGGGVRAWGSRTRVMGKDVSGSEHEVVRGAIKLAPKMVFLLLPLFAGLLALIYMRARLMFIEHLVISLHSIPSCFWASQLPR